MAKRGRPSKEEMAEKQRLANDVIEDIIFSPSVLTDYTAKHPLLVKYAKVNPPLPIPRTEAYFSGLFPKQINVLEHAARHPGGLVCALTLGGGKFLISMLLAVIKKAKKPLLIVPPKLLDQTYHYYADWVQLIPEIGQSNIEIVSTGGLSSAKFVDFLDSSDFDMIIIDECQDFKSEDSARSKRLKRYLEEKKPILCLLTATLFTKSFKDLWLLKYVAPSKIVPTGPLYLSVYDAIIKLEASQHPAAEGMTIDSLHQWDTLVSGTDHTFDSYKNRELNAGILMKRIKSYPNVVIDSEDSCPTHCRSHYLQIEPTDEIKLHINNIMNEWTAPNGECIVDALEYHRIADYTSLGFHRTFNILDNDRYLEYESKRRAWGYLLKSKLNGENQFLDSMLVVKNAIRREGGDELRILEEWEEISKIKVRESEYVWLNKNIILEALTNLSPGTLIWYLSLEVERELQKLGFRIREDSTEKIPETHACSFFKFHAGANFQDLHSNNLFLQVPVGRTALIDQAIGRTHRSGQKKPVNSIFLKSSRYHEYKFGKIEEESAAISTFQGGITKFLRF